MLALGRAIWASGVCQAGALLRPRGCDATGCETRLKRSGGYKNKESMDSIYRRYSDEYHSQRLCEACRVSRARWVPS